MSDRSAALVNRDRTLWLHERLEMAGRIHTVEAVSQMIEDKREAISAAVGFKVDLSSDPNWSTVLEFLLLDLDLDPDEMGLA